MQNQNIKTTDVKSAQALVISQNSPIEVIENPKTGNLFFVCGSITGYISPNAIESLRSGKGIESLRYCKFSVDNNPAVPCLMTVGSGKDNVRFTLGENLLR